MLESSMLYVDAVIGAAIFDLNGLPKEYLTSKESQDLGWVQTVFQALGLQSLLMSSLRLEGLRHVVVHGLDFQAIVVRQETCYIALLLRSVPPHLDPQFIQWARNLEPATLRKSPRLQSH
ncbi:hypothetical protein [Leptolyngbya ohadii]|uniref:hypothetical protein n=1 Tax=Leptolyngbya ohadii TaxID=1962290 RepID=UPI000B59D10A|nr:hypothetical protein [Leptolyngbya ohadii]